MREKRKIHKAKYIAPNGDVSPLCAKTPKAINMKLESWVNQNEGVTCDKCLKIINWKEQ